jgi:aspartate 1-decarboxylase
MTPEEAKEHKPRVVIVDENNDPKEILDNTQPGTSYDMKSGLVDNTLID